MFAYAHIYFSKQLTGAIQPEQSIGAILPDCALMKIISWDDLHDMETIESFGLISGEPLVTGLRHHYLLDQRSDHTYLGKEGYAYTRQNQKLLEAVAKGCNTGNRKNTRILAHNFIESGVDYNLLQSEGWLQEQLVEAVDRYNFDKLANQLASYFKKEPKTVMQGLIQYCSLLKRYNLYEISEWVALWREINALLFGQDIDEAQVREAMILACDITKADYKAVLISPRG